ncbi:hypothetical protein KO525_06280 [Psychrosphaera sp. B3R10]|uniref:Uncharacterized protein n=1 Tax=Psychrosphaera algicola TaxID=3023714 RepID=A0ABT5F8M8_9GAMM|nr:MULTISPECIES: hypothetical protein [unclassified Psychrosphaera]MBU2882302.1 hypothetical protein [Psychrosphaera sp. I2R16]MBU2988983.1 hypothetical protein [Psychrosphaera sp. B3R10]MDC2887892.1 hypothetical protein [Psychrosphaera sp. G1-22]
MHIDKAKKRISKHLKSGFKGYPQITLEYFGQTAACANEVAVQFIFEEGADVQVERFTCEEDARESELIQSTIVKIIERTDVKTVLEIEGVTIL